MTPLVSTMSTRTPFSLFTFDFLFDIWCKQNTSMEKSQVAPTGEGEEGYVHLGPNPIGGNDMVSVVVVVAVVFALVRIPRCEVDDKQNSHSGRRGQEGWTWTREEDPKTDTERCPFDLVSHICCQSEGCRMGLDHGCVCYDCPAILSIGTVESKARRTKYCLSGALNDFYHLLLTKQ